jgi:hypothetical protein
MPTLILIGSGDIADNRLRSRVFSKLPLAPRPATIEVTQNPVSSKPLARRTLRVPTIRRFLMHRSFIAGA